MYYIAFQNNNYFLLMQTLQAVHSLKNVFEEVYNVQVTKEEISKQLITT